MLCIKLNSCWTLLVSTYILCLRNRVQLVSNSLSFDINTYFEDRIKGYPAFLYFQRSPTCIFPCLMLLFHALLSSSFAPQSWTLMAQTHLVYLAKFRSICYIGQTTKSNAKKNTTVLQHVKTYINGIGNT